MLQAWVLVSDIEQYNDCRLSALQSLINRYQAARTVKDQRMSVQPGMMTRHQDGNLYLHRRYTFRLATTSVRRIVGLQG